MAVTRSRRTKQSTPSAKDKDRLKDASDLSEAAIVPVEEPTALEVDLSASSATQKTQVEANTSISSSTDREGQAPEQSLMVVPDIANTTDTADATNTANIADTAPFADASGLNSTMMVDHTEQEGAGAVINQPDSSTTTAVVSPDASVHPDPNSPQAQVQDVMAQIDTAKSAISLPVSGAISSAVPIQEATISAQDTTVPLQDGAVAVRHEPLKSVESVQQGQSSTLLSEFEVLLEKVRQQLHIQVTEPSSESSVNFAETLNSETARDFISNANSSSSSLSSLSSLSSPVAAAPVATSVSAQPQPTETEHYSHQSLPTDKLNAWRTRDNEVGGGSTTVTPASSFPESPNAALDDKNDLDVIFAMADRERKLRDAATLQANSVKKVQGSTSLYGGSSLKRGSPYAKGVAMSPQGRSAMATQGDATVLQQASVPRYGSTSAHPVHPAHGVSSPYVSRVTMPPSQSSQNSFVRQQQTHTPMYGGAPAQAVSSPYASRVAMSLSQSSQSSFVRQQPAHTPMYGSTPAQGVTSQYASGVAMAPQGSSAMMAQASTPLYSGTPAQGVISQYASGVAMAPQGSSAMTAQTNTPLYGGTPAQSQGVASPYVGATMPPQGSPAMTAQASPTMMAQASTPLYGGTPVQGQSVSSAYTGATMPPQGNAVMTAQVQGNASTYGGGMSVQAQAPMSATSLVQNSNTVQGGQQGAFSLENAQPRQAQSQHEPRGTVSQMLDILAQKIGLNPDDVKVEPADYFLMRKQEAAEVAAEIAQEQRQFYRKYLSNMRERCHIRPECTFETMKTDELNKKAYDFARDFVNIIFPNLKPDLFLLNGDFGTGKTVLCHVVANYFLQLCLEDENYYVGHADVPFVAITTMEELRVLRYFHASEYAENRNQREQRFRELCRVDLLILDGLCGDSQALDPFNQRIFNEVLRFRSSNCKPMMITTPIDLPNLHRAVGDLCFEGLRSFSVAATSLLGQSRRPFIFYEKAYIR